MELQRILCPLLFLTCIQLSIVAAGLRNSKQTFIANAAHPQIQRKVNGRHKSHIVTLYGDNHDNIERRQRRGAKLEANSKALVVSDEHSVKRKVNGRYNSHFKTLAGGKRTLREEPEEKVKEEKPKTNVAAAMPTTNLPKTTVEPRKQDTGNNSDSSTGANPFPQFTANMVDTKTAFFILMAVTVLVIGCFVFKIVRARSRRKTKKYGILATRGSEVELTPLDQDEDDEDMTVFDANSK